jgi:hypothetical protein
MITAKLIADSLSPEDVRITTLQLRYPKFIHQDFMTHRVFSRCASSSRAVPVAKVLNQVRLDPAMPIHWGANRPGMQALEELPQILINSCKEKWIEAANAAADIAEVMALGIGLHKQTANRILEPFMFIHVVVTSTEWGNFFELRDHADAQPEMRELAIQMRKARSASAPEMRHRERDTQGAWHLPYITEGERAIYEAQPHMLAKMSAARCARVSYENHDGTEPDMKKDLELFEKLAGSTPRHASPLEHQAYPLAAPLSKSRNFTGWRQFREVIEG